VLLSQFCHAIINVSSIISPLILAEGPPKQPEDVNSLMRKSLNLA